MSIYTIFIPYFMHFFRMKWDDLPLHGEGIKSMDLDTL
jgi:hypothetical protein